MRLFLFFLVLTPAIFFSCTKKSSDTSTCHSSEPTTRVIINKAAKVFEAGGQFYLVEYANNIDTKLLPCNLSPVFQVNGLMVTISGNVKETVKNTPTCCTENFEITNIRK